MRMKRGGHLWSKMRFLSSQLEGYLGDPAAGRDAPWRRGARNGNTMAQRLASGVAAIGAQTGRADELKIIQPVQSNEVFMSLPPEVLRGIFADGHACLDIGAMSGNGRPGEIVRCVCCWGTTSEEVDAFLRSARRHASPRANGKPPASKGKGASSRRPPQKTIAKKPPAAGKKAAAGPKPKRPKAAAKRK